MSSPSRVLIVAGSDSSGGAGIQADIKTVTALGGYAATAITALTAQDTLAVHEVVAVEARFVELQMRVVLNDIGVDAVKTGMLGSAETVEAVARTCAKLPSRVPVVVDPVLHSTSGAALFDPGSECAVHNALLPVAALLTPNVPEATVLTGTPIESRDDMLLAAGNLLAMGPRAVLLKGGHLDEFGSADVFDLLMTRDGDVHWFESPRINTTSLHGTGCTLASAITVGLADGNTLYDAIGRARRYVLEAIQTAPGFGSGIGPLNHCPTPPRENP
jgi:hydroxymethylpyrimidine/phosphomethylpyrimidine kinase